ncbi:uncharacterized methyltransferase at1g78140 chloroplastic [Phtheirospermum japonicum]|uniref:Uncharacterized methyltransferase at1g78140 chloroplastic n=1 Tax=Phtheirospermum japonicum TaxID=374723 RepID=A0A830CP88_9LAMI|nr:uncharacterized methyltransferase at1g78140 chloroplastic [Phtheirospermum japonicum]
MVKLMATVVRGNSISPVSGASLPTRPSSNPVRRRFAVAKSTLLIPAKIHARLFADKPRASSAAVVETNPDVIDETKLDIRKNILACPICYERLIWNGDPDLYLDSVARSTLQCSTCRKSYSGKDSHIDLTITGGGKVLLSKRHCPQFELIKDYLKPVLGGNIIDASCGSGMFSRLFAKSGLFSLVVALDFSETMLKQCYDFIKQDDSFPEENLIMVRADISRLPFGSSSVDAVHAGAALHCWPSPSTAVAEISRVLKPGGIFVATTYIVDGALSYFPLRRPLRQNIAQLSGSHVFLSETELEDLCTSCGLVNFSCTRNRLFVMISAMKPV